MHMYLMEICDSEGEDRVAHVRVAIHPSRNEPTSITITDAFTQEEIEVLDHEEQEIFELICRKMKWNDMGVWVGD